MRSVETVVLLVALAAVVAAFARRLRVPAPSLLVAAGLVEVLDDDAVVPTARAFGWHVAAFNGAMF